MYFKVTITVVICRYTKRYKKLLLLVAKQPGHNVNSCSVLEHEGNTTREVLQEAYPVLARRLSCPIGCLGL